MAGRGSGYDGLDILAQARVLAADPLAMIDEVTGLGSTREFVGVLADEIERLRREVAT